MFFHYGPDQQNFSRPGPGKFKIFRPGPGPDPSGSGSGSGWDSTGSICDTTHTAIATTMIKVFLSIYYFDHPFPLLFITFAPTFQFQQKSPFERK